MSLGIIDPNAYTITFTTASTTIASATSSNTRGPMTIGPPGPSIPHATADPRTSITSSSAVSSLTSTSSSTPTSTSAMKASAIWDDGNRGMPVVEDVRTSGTPRVADLGGARTSPVDSIVAGVSSSAKTYAVSRRLIVSVGVLVFSLLVSSL